MGLLPKRPLEFKTMVGDLVTPHSKLALSPEENLESVEIRRSDFQLYIHAFKHDFITDS